MLQRKAARRSERRTTVYVRNRCVHETVLKFALTRAFASFTRPPRQIPLEMSIPPPLPLSYTICRSPHCRKLDRMQCHAREGGALRESRRRGETGLR